MLVAHLNRLVASSNHLFIYHFNLKSGVVPRSVSMLKMFLPFTEQVTVDRYDLKFITSILPFGIES